MDAPFSLKNAMKGAQVGVMRYSRFKADAARDWQTGLLVREDIDIVDALGPTPEIDLREGVIRHERALLVVLIAKIADGGTCECWFNYYCPNGQTCFQDLARQGDLPVILFTPAPARMLLIQNGLRGFFRNAARRAADRGAWTMKDFEAAQSWADRTWPEVEFLWSDLPICDY